MATLAANAIAPGLLDRYLARTGFSSQQIDRPRPAEPRTNLWKPADGPDGHDNTAHGSFDDRSWKHSAQLWASHHHGVLGLAIAATVAGVATGLARR